MPRIVICAVLFLAACGADQRSVPDGAKQVSPPASTQQPGEPGTITLSTVLPASADPCLNQAVKDLGLSPKREARTWTIGGEKLHGALARDGKLVIRIDPQPAGFDMKLTTSWTGPLEPPGSQADIEQRLADIARNVSVACGEVRPVFRCNVSLGAGQQTQCTHAI